MSFPSRETPNRAIGDYIADYVEKPENSCGKILSRIARTAFSQAKWYLYTPGNSTKSRHSDERGGNQKIFIMINLRIITTKTTTLQVDFYLRHANPLGRFLREATGRARLSRSSHLGRAGGISAL